MQYVHAIENGVAASRVFTQQPMQRASWLGNLKSEKPIKHEERA